MNGTKSGRRPPWFPNRVHYQRTRRFRHPSSGNSRAAQFTLAVRQETKAPYEALVGFVGTPGSGPQCRRVNRLLLVRQECWITPVRPPLAAGACGLPIQARQAARMSLSIVPITYCG